jgi:hypothetical protein
MRMAMRFREIMYSILMVSYSTYCSAQTLGEVNTIDALQARFMNGGIGADQPVSPQAPAFQTGYPTPSYGAVLNPVGPGSGVGTYGDVGGTDFPPKSKGASGRTKRRLDISALAGTRVGSEYPGDAPVIPRYDGVIAGKRGKNYVMEGNVDLYDAMQDIYLKGN